MSDSETGELEAQDLSGRFERGAAENIRDRTFPVAVRGYDRRSVDEFVQEMFELVNALEGRQSREEVVQRALDQVGEETAGILQRAHRTADEIAARSRAQAEGRIQRAEREAEISREQADDYAEKVIVDTQLLWEERQRLLDDIRQLADDVLATADVAADRVSLPEGLPAPEAPAGPELVEDPVDQPTAEVELGVLQGGGEQEPLDEPTEQYEEPAEADPAEGDLTEEHPAAPGYPPSRAPDSG